MGGPIRSVRAGSTSPRTLPGKVFRASLFVDGLADAPCATSEDTDIVEYFTMNAFDGSFSIQIQQPTPASNTYIITPICPPRETREDPPAAFDVVLATRDRSSTASCADGQSITLANPAISPSCAADEGCSFTLSAMNTVTETIYSATELEIDLTAQQPPFTIIPDLEPATMPLCPDVVASTGS